MEEAYIRKVAEYGICYKKLKPTGRYKLVKGGPYYSKWTLYVEHKNLLFKEWIHESEIEFYELKQDCTFDCKD